MDYSIDYDRHYQPSGEQFPLFHVTLTFNNLLSILKSGFRVRYCTEVITNNFETIRACFPMVSFTNIAADKVHLRMCSYGTYAIGLKKEWGSINKLNPVLYLDRNSDYMNDVIAGFHRIKEIDNFIIDAAVNGRLSGDKHLLYKMLIDLFSYAKNFDGELVRNETLIDASYPFGLEREWRYISKNASPRFIIQQGIDKKYELNKTFHESLSFTMDDVEYIIIEEEWQELELIHLIISKGGDPSKIKFRYNNLRVMPTEG